MSLTPFDPSEYRQYAGNIDLPEDELDELIVNLRARLQGFVNRAFGEDCIRLSRGKTAKRPSRTEKERAILGSNSMENSIISPQPKRLRDNDDSRET